jgi:pyrroline-5-carboxylate reductase
MNLLLVGGGNMGRAFLRGILRHQSFTRDSITVIEPSKSLSSLIRNEEGVEVVEDLNALGERRFTLLMLAIKPDTFCREGKSLQSTITSNSSILSCMAGVTIQALKESLQATKIVRAMPNLAVAVDSGVIPYAVSKDISEAEESLIKEIFSLLGFSFLVEEGELNLHTALSGSAPGYLSFILEMMIDYAKSHGINHHLSERCMIEIICGMGALFRSDQNLTPKTLRERVTSPGGTTAAAVGSFNESELRRNLFNGIDAALKRAGELSC